MSRRIGLDSERRLLRVSFPFDERVVELLRQIPGRQWRKSERAWMLPCKALPEALRLLEPLGFVCDPEVEALRGPRPPTPGPQGREGSTLDPRVTAVERVEAEAAPRQTERSRSAQPEVRAFGVAELNAVLRQTVQSAFPREIWLVGELLGLTQRGEHVFFELIEKGEHSAVKAKVGVVLWGSERPFVEYRLRACASPFTLADGLLMRFRCAVDFFVASGQFRLIVRDVDPSFTLGDLARRRAELLQRLESRGLRTRNLALPLALAPMRIALLTSADGDAQADFLHELAASRLAFAVDVYPVRVQGAGLVPSILAALRELVRRHDAGAAYDVVVLTRGGGARADLVGFDDESLAVAVATLPIKVVVGIGHQRDRSVLDELAHSEKTPTAAAALLVSRARETLEGLHATAQVLLEASRALLDAERKRMEQVQELCCAASRAHLAFANGRLTSARERLPLACRALQSRFTAELGWHRQRLAPAAAHALQRTNARCNELRTQLALVQPQRGLQHRRAELRELRERLERALKAQWATRRHVLAQAALSVSLLDPQRVLARGYARLRTRDGRVLTSAAQTEAAGRFVVELRDGSVAARTDVDTDEE